jgi:hypothetical protein
LIGQLHNVMSLGEKEYVQKNQYDNQYDICNPELHQLLYFI